MRNRNISYRNYKFNSNIVQQQSQDINLQQHFPKIKYIVHKFPTEIRTDLITNHITRVILKNFHT